MRILQAVFRNDPPCAPLGSADTPHPQACTDIPIALAAETGAIDEVADVREQVCVAARSLWHPAACGRTSGDLPPPTRRTRLFRRGGVCGSGGARRWECAASFRRNLLELAGSPPRRSRWLIAPDSPVLSRAAIAGPSPAERQIDPETVSHLIRQCDQKVIRRLSWRRGR